MMLLFIQNNCNCDGFNAWLWPLIGAFLLGLLLGWLFSRIFGGDDDNSLEDRCARLQADLDACRSKSSSKKKVVASSKKVAASSFATKTKLDDSIKDNLTKVEGIGPKIQELFNNDGIWSWKQLSNAEVSRLQKILAAAGSRYRVHNPETWPKQAGMADRGEWEKLKKWQDEHKRGRA